MEAKPAETRLNYFKNFNHINKDQLGAMEIFGPRSNDEIHRIMDEMDEIDVEQEEIEEEEEDSIESYINNNDVGTDGIEDDEGLSINNNEPIIYRTHSYPYGFGSPPKPTFTDKPGIRSKTSPNILTYESFKNSLNRK